MKDTIFRVFDHNDHYHQSYSNQLPDAFSYAKTCADSINGRVVRVELGEDGLEQESPHIEVYNTLKKK